MDALVTSRPKFGAGRTITNNSATVKAPAINLKKGKDVITIKLGTLKRYVDTHTQKRSNAKRKNADRNRNHHRGFTSLPNSSRQQ